jgi:hypothetical protein
VLSCLSKLDEEASDCRRPSPPPPYKLTRFAPTTTTDDQSRAPLSSTVRSILHLVTNHSASVSPLIKTSPSAMIGSCKVVDARLPGNLAQSSDNKNHICQIRSYTCRHVPINTMLFVDGGVCQVVSSDRPYLCRVSSRWMRWERDIHAAMPYVYPPKNVSSHGYHLHVGGIWDTRTNIAGLWHPHIQFLDQWVV